MPRRKENARALTVEAQAASRNWEALLRELEGVAAGCEADGATGEASQDPGAGRQPGVVALLTRRAS